MDENQQPASGRYSRPAIVLHWVVASLIIANLLIALLLDQLSKPALSAALGLHKSFGITVLGLATLRLLWRLGHRPPPMVPLAPWERGLAHIVHWGFYALMFALPLTGWLMVSTWKGAPDHPLVLFTAIPFPYLPVLGLDPETKRAIHDAVQGLHGALGWVAWTLFALHVAGAAKHQWLDGHAELQRMGVRLSPAGAGASPRVKTQ